MTGTITAGEGEGKEDGREEGEMESSQHKY